MNIGGVSFQYDPFGRRTTKTIAGATTNYLYDGVNPVQELSGGTPTANLLSGGMDEVFTRTDSAGARNLLTDGLGSTLALADSTGTIQTQYTYEPFGNTTASGAASANPFQYTGRENDGTGLYFYRARYYSPTLERFISEDPIGDWGGFNHYAYANDNPISLKDPFGLSSMAGRAQCTPCVKPNFLNTLEIPILQSIAEANNETVGIGLGISGGLGDGIGVAGGWSGSLVVSPNGQAGFAFTLGSTPVFGPVAGAGILGGPAIIQSGATSPGQLAGYGVDFGVSAADGLGVGGDVSIGNGGIVTTVNTVGFGLGGNGHGGVIQQTVVIPICE